MTDWEAGFHHDQAVIRAATIRGWIVLAVIAAFLVALLLGAAGAILGLVRHG